MATRFEVTCVTTSNKPALHERIKYIGGIRENGKPWKATQQEAIELIEENLCSFYVTRGGKKVDVVIGYSNLGNKFIKLATDDKYAGGLIWIGENSRKNS